MKKFFMMLLVLSVLSGGFIAFAQDEGWRNDEPQEDGWRNDESEVDIAIVEPADVAKQYVAQKYGLNVADLTTGDVMIGRDGATVDVIHGYETEKVYLNRKDFSDQWAVTNSEPNWE